VRKLIDYKKVIIKNRLTLEKKYLNKDINILFKHGKNSYLYDHDETVKFILSDSQSNVANTRSWKKNNGGYNWPKVPRRYITFLEQYKLGK
jgi:hypothetical protein|tara:strand:- start:3314 stop:3586 length:273 start_codon:yes stop_codon:yes gene_type:complete